MKDVRLDRGVQKTRKLYEAALIELLKTNDINRITVTDLSKMADVSRGTFYTHYDDIYDLLESVENSILEELTRIVSIEPHKGEIFLFEEEFTNIVNALKYAETNKEIFRVLLNDRGSLLFLNRLKNIFSEKLLTRMLTVSFSDEKYNSILTAFYITGFIGAIQEWMKNDFNISAFELASLIKAMLKKGAVSFNEEQKKKGKL